MKQLRRFLNLAGSLLHPSYISQVLFPEKTLIWNQSSDYIQNDTLGRVPGYGPEMTSLRSCEVMRSILSPQGSTAKSGP